MPIAGILTSRPDLLGDVLGALAQHLGRPDIVGDWQPFDHTSYYEAEMGRGLRRCFVSFESLRPAASAAAFKSWAIEVEDRFRVAGRRAVNIDPGFLDANKVVLVSGKPGGHKICIAPGIYADLLLWYNKRWQAFPWAFPDFRDASLFPLFSQMRSAYKSQLRGIFSSTSLEGH